MIFLDVTVVEKFYIVTSFITAAGSLFLGILVFGKNKHSQLNRRYVQLSFFIGMWSLSLFICHTRADFSSSLAWNRALHLFSIFIPISFFHFTLHLLNIKKRKWLFGAGYFMAFALAFFAFTPLLVKTLEPKFDFRIWPVPGPLYLSFLGFFTFYSYYSLWLIFRAYRKANGFLREQLRLIFIGLFIGFNGGSTNFAYFYNIHFPPIGNLFVFLYLIFLAYAIVKYRFMDIKLVFTRAGIFLTVYTLVLGIPILVGFKTMGQGPWLLPVLLMAFLATAGPFIYLFIQKRAEDRMLSEQRKYQATLRQASVGMGRIRDLKKLLNLIVFILTRVVRIENSFIYLVDRQQGVCRLSAFRRMSSGEPVRDMIRGDDPIVSYFTSNLEPLVYGEIHHRTNREKDANLMLIDAAMHDIKAEIVFPIFIRSDLTAIVVLGKKVNGRVYSEDDMVVFSILANQASLAIENALSYEDMKKTQAQLFKADKMATIGIMADGLSHQINNRLHAMGFIASDMIDTLKMRKPLFATPELKAVADELEHSLFRVQENVTRGGEIVQGLLKYTRKGEEGFLDCNIDDIVNTSYEMAQFKIRSNEFQLVKVYDPNTIPKIRANFTQLQEVFFNLIDNAFDATLQRRSEMKEDAYVPTLKVGVKAVEGAVEIAFTDNGIGVNQADKAKLFTPFFTTKATSKKGTGLGLYVIRKIIEENHGGKVEMNSVHGQGTEVVLKLHFAASSAVNPG